LQLPRTGFSSYSVPVYRRNGVGINLLVISIRVLGRDYLFLGRMMIVWSFGFFKHQFRFSLYACCPPGFFNQWLKWNGGQVSLTDFAFWCFFLIIRSILYGPPSAAF
jgi:hypothetical protein